MGYPWTYTSLHRHVTSTYMAAHTHTHTNNTRTTHLRTALMHTYAGICANICANVEQIAM